MQLITNAIIVNEGRQQKGSVLIRDGKIEEIFADGELPPEIPAKCKITDARGKYLLPGVIDAHVHFREPGLTNKGDIYSESRAAVAGGVTSYMEMPNTVPPTTTHELLDEKVALAAQKSLANYSFYIGATNDNIKELLKTDFSKTCGIKLFMGSSTGNMLINDKETLNEIFSLSPGLVAVHCEDDGIISNNLALSRKKYGDDIPFNNHPIIRSAEACYKSSSLAVELAHKYNTRLHVLHVSTARETKLFDNNTPLSQKRITSEICVHYLWFRYADYGRLGARIKCNPAIKYIADSEQLFKALLDGTIDTVASDHAPHCLPEKQNTYLKSPSGSPFVQHSLPAMLEFVYNRNITIEQVVEKMCHNPAILFGVKQRGFIRKGYWADLILVDKTHKWQVNRKNIFSKCNWSPFEGQQFHSMVTHTWVNGNLAYCNGNFDEESRGMALQFTNDGSPQRSNC
jgi:dihydroorotase